MSTCIIDQIYTHDPQRALETHCSRRIDVDLGRPNGKNLLASSAIQFPFYLNIGSVALRAIHGIGRSTLAALIFVKLLGFDAVATIVATESNAVSHR